MVSAEWMSDWVQEEGQVTTRAHMGCQILLAAWVTSWSAAWQEDLAPLLEVKLHTRCGMTYSIETTVLNHDAADLSDAYAALL